MKKKLILNTLRSVGKTKSRFIAIMAIIAIGCGFFAGVKSCGPDMKLSAADYLQKQNLADFHLMSTLGFDEDNISEARQFSAADEIYAGYSADLMIANPNGNDKIVKVYSYSPDCGMNLPYVTEGRLPQSPDEVFADERFFSTDTPEIGDKLTLKTGDDREFEDVLSRKEYTVVGKGIIPMYIAFDRGSTNIGNGVINGWLLIPEENFTYEVHTDVYISLAETADTDPYSDDYEEIITRETDILEDLADVMLENRKKAVLDEAYEEINDAKAEIEDGKKDLADAEKEVEDGKKKLADAEKDLADGEKELADAEKELADGRKEVEDGEKELDDAKIKVSDAEKELSDAKKEVADGEKELADAKKQVADGEKELADGKKELEKAEKEIADAKKQISDGEKEYNSGKTQLDGLNSVISQFEGIILKYKTETADAATASQTANALKQTGLFGTDDNFEKLVLGYMMTPADYDDGTKAACEQGLDQYLTALKGQSEEAEKALSEAASELEKARKQVTDGEKELASARKEIAENEKKLSDAKKEIAENEQKLTDAKAEITDGEKELSDARKEIAENEVKLSDARQELTDGEAEIESGKTEIEEGKTEIEDAKKEISDGEAKISDAKKDIADAEEKLADAEKELHDKVDDAEIYVFDRDFYPAYSNYPEDCDRVTAIADVFPIFFILVAALVCCTTMTRMVEEQRTQTGTLKALGYGRFAIIAQYVVYALAASIPGSIIGLLIGFNTIPPIVSKCYNAMYNQPYFIFPFRWNYAIGCTVAACLCTGLSALYSSRLELVSCPAKLMRPKPPKDGKRILLERIAFIWNRMKFTTKVTFRNLFRYKARLLMTVIGIAGCTALLLTGYGLQYAITSIVDKQYGNIFLYDVLVALDTKADTAEYGAAVDICENSPLSSGKIPIMQHTVDISSSSEKQETYLLVTDEPEKLREFIDLHERKSGSKLSLGNGVVLGEKLARLLGVKTGDSVCFESGTPVTVTAICENYTFNYAYMTREAYENAGLDDEYKENVVLMNMTEVTDENEDAVSSELVKNDAVLAVSFSSHGGDKFRDLVSSLSMVIVVIIVAAGALAFVVLFNLSNININERTHELATIKVLGFYDGEVAAYVYRENVLLTLMGTAAGLGLGVALEKFVIKTSEVDSVMFSAEIPVYCFLEAAALTVVFALAVNITLYFRLKKIDMATSLKAIE